MAHDPRYLTRRGPVAVAGRVVRLGLVPATYSCPPRCIRPGVALAGDDARAGWIPVGLSFPANKQPVAAALFCESSREMTYETTFVARSAAR